MDQSNIFGNKMNDQWKPGFVKQKTFELPMWQTNFKIYLPNNIYTGQVSVLDFKKISYKKTFVIKNMFEKRKRKFTKITICHF